MSSDSNRGILIAFAGTLLGSVIGVGGVLISQDIVLDRKARLDSLAEKLSFTEAPRNIDHVFSDIFVQMKVMAKETRFLATAAPETIREIGRIESEYRHCFNDLSEDCLRAQALKIQVLRGESGADPVELDAVIESLRPQWRRMGAAVQNLEKAASDNSGTTIYKFGEER